MILFSSTTVNLPSSFDVTDSIITPVGKLLLRTEIHHRSNDPNDNTLYAIPLIKVLYYFAKKKQHDILFVSEKDLHIDLPNSIPSNTNHRKSRFLAGPSMSFSNIVSSVKSTATNNMLTSLVDQVSKTEVIDRLSHLIGNKNNTNSSNNNREGQQKKGLVPIQPLLLLLDVHRGNEYIVKYTTGILALLSKEEGKKTYDML